jgi:hypothetical protein
MGKINYVKGDIFEHLPKDVPVIIPHICNDVGAFEKGFVAPLSKRFPRCKEEYLRWFQNKFDVERMILFGLSKVQFVHVGQNITVANMIAQKGLISADNPSPIKYAALTGAMGNVAYACTVTPDCQIYTVKFGSNLAGGDWKYIEHLINELWVDSGFSVTVYHLD